MGPRAGLDRCGKSRPHRDSILNWVPCIKTVFAKTYIIVSLHRDRKLFLKEVSGRLWRFNWYKIK